ncbi:flotillin [Salirhabdus euzebyi]|uniref:Flotillin n=1 Tax=Salirhabdus euzebyi TaxID=394506 RepID=A0A841Q2L6_9BACI|nr:flotillin family protein [Salirhabdus euzebyi]MBB6452785.1 flotillin [Salirhabdus euzebyi]
MTSAISVPIIVAVVLVVLALAFWLRYKTVSSDEAMIITGSFLGKKNVLREDSGKSIKIVRGGGAFILPVFQKAEMMSLRSLKLDVSTPEVYTEQGVPVIADGVAIIKVGSTTDDVATAAEQFMGKPIDDLKSEAQEVLEGHLRSILGTMTVEEVYKNRDRFAQEVQGVAAKDLKKMGLQIVSFTIRDIQDKNGYLSALGKPRIAAVKRDAEIAEAEAIRDSRIQKARADEEGQKAELLRDTNIAEASKEKELKIASFTKDQDRAKAEADQAYARQEAISQQEVVQEQMKVELVRKERQIDIEEKEILRREKQYDSEIRKKADADRYHVEQSAIANKTKSINEADAQQYRIEAEARAKAEAERTQGIAEAEVIRQKGLAEAEAKERVAEAFEKYGQAAILDILAKMLPELAEKIATPIANIDKVTVVDTGNGDGAKRISNYVTDLMATAPEMVKNVSGIDMEQLIKNLSTKGTVNVPTNNVETTTSSIDTHEA